MVDAWIPKIDAIAIAPGHLLASSDGDPAIDVLAFQTMAKFIQQHAIVAATAFRLLCFEARHLVEDRSELNLAIRPQMNAVKTHLDPRP
jgi:hypothetical protein